MERLITLSSDELLERWKLGHYYEPLRTDCQLTVTMGIDLDALLKLRMRERYISLLLSEPNPELPVTDLTPDLTLTRAPDGAGLVSRPADCLRVVLVKCQGWMKPARILTDPDSAEARAQASPMAHGGCYDPVAIVFDDSILLYTPPADSEPRLEKLLAVTLPPDDTYVLTPYLLTRLTEADYELQ